MFRFYFKIVYFITKFDLLNKKKLKITAVVQFSFKLRQYFIFNFKVLSNDLKKIIGYCVFGSIAKKIKEHRIYVTVFKFKRTP